jgi:hypothetical protein
MKTKKKALLIGFFCIFLGIVIYINNYFNNCPSIIYGQWRLDTKLFNRFQIISAECGSIGFLGPTTYGYFTLQSKEDKDIYLRFIGYDLDSKEILRTFQAEKSLIAYARKIIPYLKKEIKNFNLVIKPSGRREYENDIWREIDINIYEKMDDKVLNKIIHSIYEAFAQNKYEDIIRLDINFCTPSKNLNFDGHLLPRDIKGEYISIDSIAFTFHSTDLPNAFKSLQGFKNQLNIGVDFSRDVFRDVEALAKEKSWTLCDTFYYNLNQQNLHQLESYGYYATKDQNKINPCDSLNRQHLKYTFDILKKKGIKIELLNK